MEQKDEAKRILCVDIDGNDDIADDDESVKYPSQGTIRCVIAIWLYMLLNKEADMTFFVFTSRIVHHDAYVFLYH